MNGLGSLGLGDRGGSGSSNGGNSRGGGGNTRTRNVSTPQFTTSSYQPPAPAFNPRALDFSTSLRLPPKTMGPTAQAVAALAAPAAAIAQPGVTTGSQSGSLGARGGGTDGNTLSDNMSALGAGEKGSSGYNKFASTRPPKMDGSVLAAGTFAPSLLLCVISKDTGD